MTLTLGWLWIFVCATARVGGLVLVAPAFSSPMINARVKMGMVLALSLVLSDGVFVPARALRVQDFSIAS